MYQNLKLCNKNIVLVKRKKKLRPIFLSVICSLDRKVKGIQEPINFSWSNDDKTKHFFFEVDDKMFFTVHHFSFLLIIIILNIRTRIRFILSLTHKKDKKMSPFFKHSDYETAFEVSFWRLFMWRLYVFVHFEGLFLLVFELSSLVSLRYNNKK